MADSSTLADAMGINEYALNEAGWKLVECAGPRPIHVNDCKAITRAVIVAYINSLQRQQPKPQSAAPAILPDCMTGPSEPCQGFRALQSEVVDLRSALDSSRACTRERDRRCQELESRLPSSIERSVIEAVRNEWTKINSLASPQYVCDHIANMLASSEGRCDIRHQAGFRKKKNREGAAEVNERTCARCNNDCHAELERLTALDVNAELERRAKAYPKLVDALRKTLELAEMQRACLGFDKTPVQADAEALLHELGDK